MRLTGVAAATPTATKLPPNCRLGVHRWAAYLQLVASSMASMVKDSAIPKYLALVKEVHVSTCIDGACPLAPLLLPPHMRCMRFV